MQTETQQEKAARVAREAQRDRDAKDQRAAADPAKVQAQSDSAEANRRKLAGEPAETATERVARVRRETGTPAEQGTLGNEAAGESTDVKGGYRERSRAAEHLQPPDMQYPRGKGAREK